MFGRYENVWRKVFYGNLECDSQEIGTYYSYIRLLNLVPNQSLDTCLSSHVQILIICIFTYVNEIVRNERKLYKKHTSKLIFVINHHCCMLLNHQ